ncbi:DUF6588 family protein [Seonamhaeicola marinus]|uniref:Uncharacterized protein n=1 Tax=Seonamhaeicola marinus TaxID=1912246 RepID=A0A5D0IKR5_9FLAO|nr:DUF6588 family protein [Seonamhaeicola marinus]TYA84395.1 hypothetical protein FUA24_07050 [Seonamhaeicola marinus]
MKKITLLMLLCFITQISKAQELESIFLASREDANKLTEAYMNPAMNGLIYGMNSGWYHTAKVHKKLGFDITIGANASMVPTKDEVFNFADLGLSDFVQPNALTSATVAGSGNGASLSLTHDYNGQTLTSPEIISMPDGISDDLPLNAVPTPAIQAGIGLPFKFDVMVRYVPEVGDDDVKGQLFGVGLKKEITSIFGPLDKLPLHVSLLAAYTNMDVNYNMDGTAVAGSNQTAEFKLNAYTAQVIASINFPIINVYGGAGYSGGNSTLKMLGEYQLEYDDGANSQMITIQDPVNLDFNTSGFRATLGARISLGFFKIFGDYTIQEYNTISGGIAFSFR